jgi:hypothetical protein
MNNKQCSELFSNIFDSGCGGCIRTCECGITYFYGCHHWDFEEGELEELQQKAKDDPDHYVEQDCSIGTLEIGGIQIVYDCSCDLARKYENFILDHAGQLAEYLNRRGAILREKAESIEVINFEESI